VRKIRSSHASALPLSPQAGRVFSGFSEGEIAFPPSFRWRRGAIAGDFTDEEMLAASYVLQKKGDGQVGRGGGGEGGREGGREGVRRGEAILEGLRRIEISET
jgi:hypothetical protein